MLSMLLERTGFFSSVHSFDTEKEVIDFFCSDVREPLFFFTDYLVPGTNVIHLIADIRRFKPSVKIVVVGGITNVPHIRQLLAHNVDGVLSKMDGTEEVINCIHAIRRNQPYLAPSIARMLEEVAPAPVNFTPREMEILTCIAQGASTSGIADRLNITTSTIFTHRKNMLAKSAVGSMTELLAFAAREGLLCTCEY